MSVSKLYANSECRVIKLSEMKFEFIPDDAMRVFKCILKDGTVLQSNFGKYWDTFRNNSKYSYFLADWTDLSNMEHVWDKCKSEKEKKEKAEEYLASMTEFSKFFKKQIYVRLIMPIATQVDKEPRVFSGEALEIIPLVLEQQKTPIDKDDDRLSTYRSQWTNIWPQAYDTVSLSDFHAALEDFDVDKSLITLVPDPSHEIMRREYMRVGGHCRLYAHNLTIVCSTHHAVNLAFETLVMGVNWKFNQCRAHENCNERMKKAILDIFGDFCLLGEDTFLSCHFVINMIENVKRLCPQTHLMAKAVPDYHLNRQDYEESVPMNHYQTVCQCFNLQRYDVFIPRYPQGFVPVWMHRMYCKLAWIQQFFVGPKEQEMKEVMVASVYFQVPEQYMTKATEFVNEILSARPRNQRATAEAQEAEEPVSAATTDAAAKMLAAQLKRNLALAKKKESKKKGK